MNIFNDLLWLVFIIVTALVICIGIFNNGFVTFVGAGLFCMLRRQLSSLNMTSSWQHISLIVLLCLRESRQLKQLQMRMYYLFLFVYFCFFFINTDLCCCCCHDKPVRHCLYGEEGGGEGGGGQMSRRDEEFHQTLTVLEHICDVSRITKVTLAFC